MTELLLFLVLLVLSLNVVLLLWFLFKIQTPQPIKKKQVTVKEVSTDVKQAAVDTAAGQLIEEIEAYVPDLGYALLDAV